MKFPILGPVGLSAVEEFLFEPQEGWKKYAVLLFWHWLPLLPFIIFKRFLLSTALLGEDAYAQPIIFWEWFLSLSNVTLVVFGAIVLGLLVLTNPFENWSAWENGSTLRILVGTAAAALAWWFSTLDVNLYFGETHLVDRFLLVGLAGLVWWRPIFVVPFLMVLFPFNAQYHYPLGNHSVAQISLSSNLLFLFAGAHLVQLISGRRMSRHFVFLIFCLIAASYVVPGLGKVQLGWVTHRHVYLMIFSSYSVGWLGFAPLEWIEQIGRWMAMFDWPIVLMTILIECGAMVLLLRRRVALVWLALFVSLNTMILVTSGIFFWTWILINATLLLLLWRRGERQAFDVFSNAEFAMSLPVILLGAFLFNPVKLAWLDAPINYTYQLEATTAAGQKVMIPTAALAPYDTHFALGNFGMLSAEPQLGIVWGAVHDLELAGRLAAAATPEEIWRIERAVGHVAFDPDGALRFDHFVRELAGRWNAGVSDRTIFSWLRAPRQVWTFQRGVDDPSTLASPIETITVYQVVSFYDGQAYEIIRRKPVRVIEIYD